MKNIISVNPFECRPWSLHDRLDVHISEEVCRAGIESVRAHGQLIPALGRPLRENAEYKYELIYGVRRLFIARHLKQPLIMEVREMSDREAIIAMDIENRHRSDISAYERGRSYARMLNNGHFESQEDLAHALKVSSSQVSRLLKLAQLPAVIVQAFGSASNICEGWGLALMEALEDDDRRQRTIRAAREICRKSIQLPAVEVYRILLSASVQGRKVKHKRHDEVVKSKSGTPLFRIRYHSSQVALVLPASKLSADGLTKVREAIYDIMDPAASVEINV